MWPHFNETSLLLGSSPQSLPLPELKECHSLLVVDSCLNATKAFELLGRARDIFLSLGANLDGRAAACLRAVVAVRAQLLVQVPAVCSARRTMNVDKFILEEVSTVLPPTEGHWDPADSEQFAVLVTLVSHLVHSYCRLHVCDGEQQRLRTPAERNIGGFSPRDHALPLLDRLIQVGANPPHTPPAVPFSEGHYKETSKQHMRSMRLRSLVVPKLHCLKAALAVPATGSMEFVTHELGQARQYLTKHVLRDLRYYAEKLGKEPHVVLEEFLVRAMLIECKARCYGWCHGVGYCDSELEAHIQELLKMMDDILSAIPMLIEKDDEILLFDMLSSVMLSVGNYYLSAPQEDKVYPNFNFSSSPFLNTKLGSDSNYSHCAFKKAVDPKSNLRAAHKTLEAALKLNRAIMPDNKLNIKAGTILRSLAGVFAESRDFLYATGLFTSAQKCVEAYYGVQSVEMLDLYALEEQYLRKIGAVKEAEMVWKKMAPIVAIRTELKLF